MKIFLFKAPFLDIFFSLCPALKVKSCLKMKILIFLAFVALASCDYPMRSDWKEIPPASAAPDFPEAFRSYPKLDSDGRIVNGVTKKIRT